MAEEETKEARSDHHPADTNGDGVVDPWVFAKFYVGCGGTSGNGLSRACSISVKRSSG